MRTLITTAIEGTWLFDRPVVFLDKWCIPHTRQSVVEKMDALVAPPSRFSKNILDTAAAEVDKLDSEMFPLFSRIINNYHSTHHSERFWRIVLGHWFSRSIRLIFNRVCRLDEVINTLPIDSVTAIHNPKYSLATPASVDFVWASNDPRWNCAVYEQIIKHLYPRTIRIEPTMTDELRCYNPPSEKRDRFRAASLLRRFLKAIRKNLCDLTFKLGRPTDALLINTYLPRREEIKLQALLGQFPQISFPAPIQTASIADSEMRKTLGLHLSAKSRTDFQRLASLLLFEMLPVCFLESFAECVRKAEMLPWPSKPDFIFTSNNFDFDELFKVWTAKKTEDGVRYVVGQHGGDYGTNRYNKPTVEEHTSDKFITWGWTDGMEQHTKGFVLTCVGRRQRTSPKGGLLLIEKCRFPMVQIEDANDQFEKYLKDQFHLCEMLNPPIQRKIIVRMKGQWKKTGKNEDVQWRQFNSNIAIDCGQTPLRRLIQRSRIVVHSYDSTGILELLAMNVPMIAFWQDGYDHLRDSALVHYQVLVDAGLVFFTPKATAEKVNKIWDDIPAWWQSSEVQEARKQFCKKYARLSNAPIRDLKQALLS